jgi:hypothetical protein
VLVRHKDLYDAIKKKIRNEAHALDYTKALAQKAWLYAAFRSPSSPQWAKYSEAVREALGLFEIAGVTQVRSLLLAVFSHFTESEVNRTIPMMASWTVRLLVYGSGGSGPLEDNYSARAKDVSEGTIRTARQLFEAFKILPSDEEFSDAFSKATVSKPSIARWYLAKLEIRKSGNSEKIVTDDLSKVNLEHIMPLNPGVDWDMDSDELRKHANRLGNQTLMDSKTNVKIGNSSFAEKQKHFASSRIELTREILNYSRWGIAEINERQEKLAQLAVAIWRNEPQ